MAVPHVAAEAPPGWVAGEASQPPLASGSNARFTQWDVARGPDGRAAFVRACVATPIPGWVEDMRGAVAARGAGVAAVAAERIAGAPVEPREAALAGESPGPERGTRYVLRIAGSPESAPRVGSARMFLGFDGGEVATCFAVCAAPPSASAAACDASVDAARLAGGTPPPPPGLVVGAASWAVHHPVRAAASAALAALVLAVLAVVTRRKPRSRI